MSERTKRERRSAAALCAIVEQAAYQVGKRWEIRGSLRFRAIFSRKTCLTRASFAQYSCNRTIGAFWNRAPAWRIPARSANGNESLPANSETGEPLVYLQEAANQQNAPGFALCLLFA